MDGYLNNTARVLNEWYDLFKQKNHTLSAQELKHWQHITQSELQNFKNDYCNHHSVEELLKGHFIFNKDTILNISTYKELVLTTDCHRLVFINGYFIPSFSDYTINPWILTFDKSPNRYTISQPICPNVFLYLTECLSDALIKIKLPEKSTTTKPLYLLHIQSGSAIQQQFVTAHYYYHINIGKDTNAFIIEHFISIDKNNHFTGTRMILSVDERSTLNHVKLIFENQNSYHISNQDINLKQFSNVSSNACIVSGPKFIRHQVNSKINYMQSSLFVNSLSILSKKDICDIQTFLEHNNTGYSISKQLHKCIASDHSTGFFKGLIKINQDSIDTDAKMVNNNLLLHKSASIYSVPKLEIYSDAVQCRHGSTIGQIDDNCLFYLNTRGIIKEDALKMLLYAFTIEITEQIKFAPLRDFIINKINYDLIRRK